MKIFKSKPKPKPAVDTLSKTYRPVLDLRISAKTKLLKFRKKK